MTEQDGRKMEGTEFIYIVEGDCIKCYVKKFDPAVGFTCMALEEETTNGVKLDTDENGESCIIGFDFSNSNHLLSDALADLKEIRDTGELDRTKAAQKSIFNPNCAF